MKCADSAELVGKLSNDKDAKYHKQIENIVNWPDENCLYMNVSNTLKMCMLTLGILNKNIKNQSSLKEKQRRNTYKYLGCGSW